MCLRRVEACSAPSFDEFQKMGFECRFIDDEPTLMWSKIVFLAPVRADDHRRGSHNGSGHRRPGVEAATGVVRAGSLRGRRGRGREGGCRCHHRGDDEDADQHAQFHAERRRARQRPGTGRDRRTHPARRRSATGSTCRLRRISWQRSSAGWDLPDDRVKRLKNVVTRLAPRDDQRCLPRHVPGDLP